MQHNNEESELSTSDSLNNWQISEIRKALIQADAGEFATEFEVNEILMRWTQSTE